jgi:hypothetical protein
MKYLMNDKNDINVHRCENLKSYNVHVLLDSCFISRKIKIEIYKSRSLKEHNLDVFKNMVLRSVENVVLRGVFGHKAEEVRRMNKNVY